MKQIFFNSQWHAPALQKRVLIPVLLITIAILTITKEGFKKFKKAIILLSYIIVTAILYGLYYYHPITSLFNKLQIGFNWGRFYFISPVFWFILFSISITVLFRCFEKKKLIILLIYIIIIVQILYGVKKYTLIVYRNMPTYEQFISKDMFDQIKKTIKINIEKDRIGCIGFYPSIANFNGFKTIGAYNGYYPLEFKHKFRKIISDELVLNNEIRDYYDNWGSRVYLFDDKVGEMGFTDQNWIREYLVSITCDLNITLLSDFGVGYLFSTVKISNADKIDLNLVYQTENNKFYYRMYVYEIE